MGMPEEIHPFATLTPDFVLDALDHLGLIGDGRLMALNSYENRVYLARQQDRERRWRMNTGPWC